RHARGDIVRPLKVKRRIALAGRIQQFQRLAHQHDRAVPHGAGVHHAVRSRSGVDEMAAREDGAPASPISTASLPARFTAYMSWSAPCIIIASSRGTSGGITSAPM